MIDLELLEARWRMGRILTSELEGVAAELTAAGHDGPALTVLAAGRADPGDTFEQVLRELGGGGMPHDRAALVLARSFAQQLLDGDAPPRLAVKAIGGLRWKGGESVDEQLVPFTTLDERYERARSLGPLAGLLVPRLDRRARDLARGLAGRG
jgi:hypothetical protein